MNSSPHTKKNIAGTRGLFLLFCGAFILGDILGCQRDILSICILVWSALVILIRDLRYSHIVLSLLLGVSLGFSLGQSATEEQMRKYDELREVTRGFTLKWHIEGTIEQLLFQKERTKVYLLSIDNFDTLDNFDKNVSKSLLEKKYTTSLFVEIPSNLTIRNGDRIGFSGKVERNITFPLHDFSRYAYFHGWFGSIFVASFEQISRVSPWIIEKTQLRWSHIFESYFPRDVAGTLLGMTIGSIDLLSRETKDAFIAAGTSHILVVSGSNIAFLIILITFFLKYFPFGKYFRFSIILWFLLFYGTIVWWEVSVVRATLMGILSYMIVEYWGTWSSRASLALACIILTFFHPLAPLYDAWFWLSFAATFGILIFHRSVERWCKKYRLPHTLISIVSVSIGAMLGSLPLIIYHFERIPVSSLLANILIWGILGWILFSSIFFVGMTLISHTLSILVGYFVYIPTKFILFLSWFFQNGWIISVPSFLAPGITVFLLWIFLFIFLEETLNTHIKSLEGS